MSITDELRDFINGADGYELWCPRHKVELADIADRIDAAHRSALEKLAAQLDTTNDMRDFLGRIEQAANNREDVTLWGVDYVPLPIDADGVPIHVGDVMEWYDHDIEVLAVGNGTFVFGYETTHDGSSFYEYNLVNSEGYSHHRAKTVEDVLREFAREIDADAYGITDAKVAEFAAKLRLAGEGE